MKTVLLIDLSGIFWACWHSSADQEVSAAFERTLGAIQKINAGYDYVAVCCDAPPYFRKEILPAYKAQRDAPPPVAIEQLNRVKSRLAADGLLIWEARGFEADDLLATACDWLCPPSPVVDGSARYMFGECSATVASSDKDLLQLVTDDGRVTVLSPMTGVRMDREKVIEKFGVAPDMIADLLALTGDASDNIPGIPGVGPKTAAKLLLEWGTLDGVLTHTSDMKPDAAVTKAIIAHGPAARLARKLVALRTDAPIDVAELFKHREPKRLVETDMSDDSLDSLGPELPAQLAERAAGSAYDPAQAQVDPKTEPVIVQAEVQRGIEKRKPSGIATYQGPEFDRGLEPATLDAAWQLAGGIFNSRLYKFPNREAVWAVIVRGREMGLGAMTALDCIHFFEGKPALHAHLIVGRAKQHPDCEYFQLVESTGESATYTCKRKGNPEPTSLTYTLEQAKVAGLCPQNPRTRNPTPGEKDRRGNWEKRPDEMLRKTCAVQLARVEFPEAILGAYAIEELGDGE